MAHWCDIEQIFEEARGLPLAQRGTFLEQTCPDEAARSELASLLEAYDEATGFFESLAVSLVVPAWDGLHESEAKADPLALNGQQLGRYSIEVHLGGGGMGVVYRARDTLLERPVALKFLAPHLASSREAAARFEREARTTSALDHFNIATIYEIGWIQAGPAESRRRYIAMAYYDGETLKKKIRRGPLPVGEALHYAIQIAEGLGRAHAAGIVHRDVKPANVIITNEDVVKLVDFGLAKAAAASGLTHPGRRMGTAAYMSPEQARGEDVDARTDLWALGVLLYEMLAGERPFHCGHDLATLYAILHEEPASLRTFRPDLPAALEQIVQGCLEKDSHRRYPSAEALRDDLCAVHRGASSIAFRIRPGKSDGPDRTIAVLPFETLGTEQVTAFTKGIHGDVLTRLSNVADLQVISRTSVRKYQHTDKTIREIGQELKAAWILEGEVQEAGTQVQVNARLIDTRLDRQVWSNDFRQKLTAENVFEIQAEITKKIAGALEAELTPEERKRVEYKPTANLQAYRLQAQGRRCLDQRTNEGMQKAQRYSERAIEHDADYALAWAGLATTLILLHEYGHDPESRGLPRAEEAADQALELDPMLAEAHAARGLLHEVRREGAQLISALERAIELRPGYAEGYNWLSWHFQLQGRPRQALESARRSVELDPLSAEAVINLAFSLLMNGKPEAALHEAHRVRELDPGWASVDFCEAMVFYHTGRFAEAKEILQDLVVPWAGSGPELTLALIHLRNGDESRVRDMLAAFEDAGDRFASGLIYAAFGNLEQAFRAFRETDWTAYWPVLAAYHYYPDVLDPLRADPHWEDLVQAARQGWGAEAEEETLRGRVEALAEAGADGRDRGLSDRMPKTADPGPIHRRQRACSATRDASGRIEEALAASNAIAVLPFDALGEEETGPFIEGIHDDLLATLSRLSGLGVISRTSVRRFRRSGRSLPAIARELGVEWVLEGSIQQVRDQVRVRVRLVNARTDRQVWTQDYGRKLTAENLFKIQGEITRKIARSLKAQLTPEEERLVDRRRTENLEAYQLYVQGRGHFHERTEKAVHQAIDYFQQAIELDESYALAWTGLADASSLLHYYDYSRPEAACDPMLAARRALALNPELGEAHASIGIAHSMRYEGPAALRALKRSTELKPSYGEAYIWRAWVHLILGQPEDALQQARTSINLNPLAPAYRVFLAESYLALGREEEALSEARRAREIQPEYGYAIFVEALALYHLKRREEAASLLMRLESLELSPSGAPRRSLSRTALAVVHTVANRRASARELLAQFESDGDSFAEGLVLAALGELDPAFDAFRNVDRWNGSMVDHIRYFYPDVLKAVREDARFAKLLQDVNECWGLNADGSVPENSDS